MNVDIPPTSFVSTYYLKQVIGENHIGDYADLKNKTTLDIDALSEKYKGVVFCPWLIPKIGGEVDLFVNFISFQEMEPDVFLPNYELVDTNTTPFGHQTEDGFHSELRIYQRR